MPSHTTKSQIQRDNCSPQYPYQVQVDWEVVGYAADYPTALKMVLERTVTQAIEGNVLEEVYHLVYESREDFYNNSGYHSSTELTDAIIANLSLSPLIYENVLEIVYSWLSEEGLLEPDWEGLAQSE